MKLKDIKIIKEIIDKEIKNNMKCIGTEWFTRLCHIQNELSLTINNLENPEKHKKLNKLINPD